VAACFTNDGYGPVGGSNPGSGAGAGPDVGAVGSGRSFYSYHGKYTPWGEWTVCDVTCGDGSRSRVRSCIKPKYLRSGTYLGCEGASSQTEACYAGQCKVDGGFTSWGPFGPINAAGIKTRSRSCTNPAPMNGGAQCVGPSSDTMTVPINGGYTSWGPFGPINAAGIKTRSRTCTNPEPMNGGAQCVGPAEDSMTVPIDGGYTSWGPFGPINAAGIKTRFRTCTNPAPMNGGAQCVGPSSDSMTVPVDGGYTSWGVWSSCSGSCGVGLRTRSRTCAAPAPLNGGRCVGKASQEEECRHYRPCSSGYY